MTASDSKFYQFFQDFSETFGCVFILQHLVDIYWLTVYPFKFFSYIFYTWNLKKGYEIVITLSTEIGICHVYL